eukprot:2505271-Alexandrium_andersonii.AAC.1
MPTLGSRLNAGTVRANGAPRPTSVAGPRRAPKSRQRLSDRVASAWNLPAGSAFASFFNRSPVVDSTR